MKRLLFAVSAVVLSLVFSCSGSGSSSGGEAAGIRTETCSRGAYSLELSYPADGFLFGSSAEFILKIKYPDNESYIMLPPKQGNDGRYSNTIISGIRQGEPVLDGSGSAVSVITFSVEAWLPGELSFPPLTVSFSETLTTDEVTIQVNSAFEEDEPRELAPLYVPDAAEPGVEVIIIIISLSAVSAVIIFFIIRQKKKRIAVGTQVKTREELIADFRKEYIETDGEVDIRAAFALLGRISGINLPEQYCEMINKARFSSDGIPADEGRRLLNEIYIKIAPEADNEL